MKSIFYSLFVLIFFSTSLLSQVNYTAKDNVPPYQDGFLYGTNMGAYTGWTDTMLANIACLDGDKQLSLNALRPALPQTFLDQWGYDIRVNEFAHYESVGAVNNTSFVGYPSPNHQDHTEYCPGESSNLFVGMYEPIWDNGENGTPVNEDNHYASYLWETVTRYKGQVRFWEIWNEPDFDVSFNYNPELGGVAWKPRATEHNAYEANWWENNPQPCHYAIKAPIFHYIRMLRISYDVIKTLDPDSYVAVGGLGYPSFLDAVMRNTDNPDNGAVTAEYPNKGGAYFDCLSYHAYPHVDGTMEEWNNDIQGFDYTRNSDIAVDGVIDLKHQFDDVLTSYGYDGQTYPKKITILTETNLPRERYLTYIGDDLSQRNFLIKMAVVSQMEDISQVCVYDLSEKQNRPDDEDILKSFNTMGLFDHLDDVPYGFQQPHNGGIAYKTVATLLDGYNYDAAQTATLALPSSIRGGAFKNADDEYMYVLWAKTEGDLTEYAQATYSFPDVLNHPAFTQYGWNASVPDRDTAIIAAQNIMLTGEPAFLRPHPSAALPIDLLSFRGYREQEGNRLEWITEQEVDNDYFVLEHSIDGASFQAIARIEGAGNSNELKIYEHMDTRPLRGNNFYRLKQVDFNGAFSYSNVVNVVVDSEDLFTIRPTHANNEVHIEFFDYYDKDIEMEVVDVLGKVRMSELLLAGRNAKTINISKLESGHYFVRMKVRGVDYFTRRFVKSSL